MAGEGSSLDQEHCQQMASLVETLTTSGRPALDQEIMKQLKKICRISDAYVEHCFQLTISQLQEDHAEIRLSAFQVINELFNRSHRFRELLVADMQDYLELTVGTNVDLPLPPPKPAAVLLKEHALRAMQEWYNKFGKAYKKLGLGYTYLKNNKKVDFVNIQARSEAERRRAEERQHRLQQAQEQKLNKVTEEMNEIIPEIQECLTQCENCFQLLLPNMTFNDLNDDISVATTSKHSISNKTKRKLINKQVKGNPATKAKQTNGKDDRTFSDTSRNSKPSEKLIHDLNKASQENCPGQDSGRSIFDLDDEDGNELDGGASSTLSEGGEGNERLVGKEDHSDLRTRNGTIDVQPGEEKHHLEGCRTTENGNEMKESKENDEGDATEDATSDEEEEKYDDDMEDNVGEERRSLLQQHGLPSWTSINIDINLGTDGVKINEDEDNTDVLQTLEDQQRLLTTRYLTRIKSWTETLSKMGKSDKVKQLIDIKREILAKQDKYKELKIKRTHSHKTKDSGSSAADPGSSGVKGTSREWKADDSEDEDDDDFSEVPDKEGYEPHIPEELRAEYGLDPLPKPSDKNKETNIDWHPVKDADNDILDPASQAGSIAALRDRMNKIREDTKPPPGYHIIPAKKTKTQTEEERKRQEMLKRAPVVSFGTDLEFWKNPDDIKAPVIYRPDTDSKTWWTGPVQDEDTVLESAKEAKDSLKTRVMNFTGSFQPVKWKCRAPLPNGTLCERMDREKCPFHGRIIARDDRGNPQDGSITIKKEKEDLEESDSSAWNDPELLADIEGVVGLDLGSASSSSGSTGQKAKGAGGKGKGGKKGKGKAKKYPGLTDISKVNNTSRKRLEKIVMNRGAMKRVAAALNKVDQKRITDKFGNNFNYSLGK